MKKKKKMNNFVSDHVLYLSRDRLYGFGKNSKNQVSFEMKEDIIIKPKLILTDPNIRSISCGESHSLIYKKDGKLYGYGGEKKSFLKPKNKKF